jgi:hypothetical protein
MSGKAVLQYIKSASKQGNNIRIYPIILFCKMMVNFFMIFASFSFLNFVFKLKHLPLRKISVLC